MRSRGGRSGAPSTATSLLSSTSRAGSVTASPPTVTRPARTMSSAARREATPAWARYLARRIRWRKHGPRAAAAHIGRPRRAPLPRRPGVVVDRPRGRLVRRDDQRRRRAARAPGRARAVLLADRRARGDVVGRDRQDAVPHRRRPASGGGDDALPRPAAHRLRLVAVGLPADL